MNQNIKRRNFLKMMGMAACGATVSPALAADERRKPNVIIILTDDIGYGDVGCYGATQVTTPNIDRIAKEGLQFTNGYASAATCTPTRYALLTGEYAWRKKGTGVAPPNAAAIIKPGRTTLASIMQTAGYATGCIGKWHLGLGDKEPDWNGELKPGPLEVGFDYCFIIPTTGDRVPSVFVENHRVVGLDPSDPIKVYNTPEGDDEPTGRDHPELLKMKYSHGHDRTIVNGISRIGMMKGGKSARWVDEDIADTLAGKAVDYIDKHKAEPFFLYFCTHDIHVPRVPNVRFKGKSNCGIRGDAIVQMDWCVGEVLNALDKAKLTEDTIVIFCSDNGPVLDDGYQDRAVEDLNGHKAAGPFRGGKYSIYEGGTRTPLLVSWPTHVKPGTSDEVVCLVDLPASFAAFTGQNLKKEAAPDSFNVMPTLLGKTGAKGRDHLVVQGRGLALREGDWKYIELPGKGKNGSPNNELYNLAEDKGETTDLARKFPERVKQMQTRLQEIRDKGRSRS